MTNAPLPPGRLGLPWIGETMSIARNNHKFYRDHLAKYGPNVRKRLSAAYGADVGAVVSNDR